MNTAIILASLLGNAVCVVMLLDTLRRSGGGLREFVLLAAVVLLMAVQAGWLAWTI